MIFRCWVAEYGDEEDACEYDLSCASSAAERHAEHRWSRDDYPEEQVIHVRCEDGTLLVFDVETSFDPTFSAMERRT